MNEIILTGENRKIKASPSATLFITNPRSTDQGLLKRSDQFQLWLKPYSDDGHVLLKSTSFSASISRQISDEGPKYLSRRKTFVTEAIGNKHTFDAQITFSVGFPHNLK